MNLPELPFGPSKKSDEKLIINTDKKEKPTIDKKNEVFDEFNSKDEKYIDELYTTGIALQEPFYESEIDGKVIYTPSWSGITQLVKKQGSLIIESITPEHTKEKFVYCVTAKDTNKQVSIAGIGTHPMIFKSNKGYEKDEFAQQKALAKAQRNAYRPLINYSILEEFLKEWYYEKYKIEINQNLIIIATH